MSSSSSSTTAAQQPAAPVLPSTPPRTPPRASFKPLPGDATHISTPNARAGPSSTSTSTIPGFNMKPHDPRPKLRDHLLNALKTLPGTRTFHLHVLQTAPRKSNALFPFAKPKPARAYLQDILILCSEQAGLHPPTTSTDPEITVDAHKGTEDKRVLVTAIEANVYLLPPTSSAVLYISKVDTTGQGALPSPTTALVRALIGYFLDPFTRPVPADQVWVQLFARAQSQYLFANSADWSGKKPLGDRQLCAWWRKVLGRTAEDVKKTCEERRKVEGGDEMDMRMFYILPGFTEMEGAHALKIAGGGHGDDGKGWVYGHPYSQKGVRMPCPGAEDGVKNLGVYIPYFDDDPKSRFLDEIAYIEGDIKSPQKKKQKMDKEAEKVEEIGATEKKDDKKALGELSKVTADEFWERMSFRQECVAGAMTGFFTVIGNCAGRYGRKESPLAPQPGQVSSAINKRVMTNMLTGVEFSTKERAIRSTESLEGAIKGLCEGLIPSMTTTTTTTTTINGLLAAPTTPSTPRPNRKKVELEVSPNPFPEPETTAETYTEYIYGIALVQNGPMNQTVVNKKIDEPVRVLTVRKKRKVVT